MTEKIRFDVLEDSQFELPVGYRDEDGVLHKIVTLTPMTGETEEDIADAKVRENGGKLVTALLNSVVVSIGTIKRVNKDIIRSLSVQDRDFLMLVNRYNSLGEEINYEDTCPHCRQKNNISINLRDIPVVYTKAEDSVDMTFDLPVGITDGMGVVHKEITITIPTGMVQERVAPLARANPAQATTIMLQLITKKLGTLAFINPDTFKKMTKKDRDFISNKMSEFKVGAEMSSDTQCSTCGAEFETNIPIMALLGE